MSDRFEILEISNCPLCNNSHKYNLKVERSFIIKMITMNDMNEQPRRVSKTRLFTCPVKNAEYQANIILYDTSSDRINSVEVIGLNKG